MPIKPDNHQAIVATSTNGMDNAVGVDLAPTVHLQRRIRGVRDDFGVHAIATLGQTKDKSFATYSTPEIATNALGAKIRLFGFKYALEGRLNLTGLSHTDMNKLMDGAANI